jgi:hypothetical protein
MVTYRRFIISTAGFCIICFSAGSAAGAEYPAGISGGVRAYCDNIEYSLPDRAGRTLFGASAVVRFFHEPSERTQFAAGVYGLRRFGDEHFLSMALPVFRARYVSERLSFIIGELDSAGAHGLPGVLYRQEYRFDPGIEEGIQIKARAGRFSTDVWVSWDSLNTREHREHFTAGGSSIVSFDNISFPLYLIADHAGGELYDVPGQPVMERAGGAAGVSFVFPLRSAFRRAWGQVLAAGSACRVRSGSGETGSGYGIMCKAGISPFGVDVSARWFRGRDLFVPAGDPLYRSSRPVYALEAARSFSMNERVSFSGGLRFETEGCSFKSYFSNPRYRWWVSMSSGFERRFGRYHDL